MPIAPTLPDATDRTAVVNLSGAAEPKVLPPANASLNSDNSNRRRIARFIDGLQARRLSAEPRQGLLDVAYTSMQAMQDAISQLRLSAYAPELTVEIPRNACDFFGFWGAEKRIEIGRERTAQAFAPIDR